MDRKNLVGPNVPTTPGNAVVWDAADGAIVRDSGVPLGSGPGSLVGQLPSSLQGEDGEPGDPGPPGLTGPAGPQGATGAPGMSGSDGEDGLPIPGSQGPQGLQGLSGPPGDDGQDGDEGLPGAPGIQGIQGTQGATGPQGSQGLTGSDGAQPEDLLALLAYAYRRIDFLEAALKISYGPHDILVPDQIVLMQPYGEEFNQWT